MLWLKRALGIALLIALVMGTLVFVLENQQTVALSYFGFSTGVFPISLFVVAAFVAGGLLGLFLAWLVVSRLRYRLRAMEARMSRGVPRES